MTLKENTVYADKHGTKLTLLKIFPGGKLSYLAEGRTKSEVVSWGMFESWITGEWQEPKPKQIKRTFGVG